jgi:hypothetical protein
VVPNSPRARLALSRACKGDSDVLCKNMPPGDGRIITCLMQHETALTPACRQAISALRR